MKAKGHEGLDWPLAVAAKLRTRQDRFLPGRRKRNIQTGQMDLAICFSSFIPSFLSCALRQCVLSQFLIQGPNVPGIAAVPDLV